MVPPGMLTSVLVSKYCNVWVSSYLYFSKEPAIISSSY